TAQDGSKDLRKLIKRLAKQILTEADALKLNAFLNRAKQLSEKRNKFIHSVWAIDMDGGDVLINKDHSVETIPPAEEIDKVANQIIELIREINGERLDSEGFIYKAINTNSK